MLSMVRRPSRLREGSGLIVANLASLALRVLSPSATATSGIAKHETIGLAGPDLSSSPSSADGARWQGEASSRSTKSLRSR